MRVLCIDTTKSGNEFITNLLVEGNVYNAEFQTDGIGTDGSHELCYKLQEDEVYVYSVKKFIPLTGKFTGNQTECLQEIEEAHEVQEVMQVQ